MTKYDDEGRPYVDGEEPGHWWFDIKWMALGVVLALVIGIGLFKAEVWSAPRPPAPHQVSQRAEPLPVCTGPPDYIGCTPKQIAKAEAGSKQRIKHHYPKRRWHQGGHQMRYVQHHPQLKHQMKRAFRQAKHRYVVRMHERGLYGEAALGRTRMSSTMCCRYSSRLPAASSALLSAATSVVGALEAVIAPPR